jgi:hypothetical protein
MNNNLNTTNKKKNEGVNAPPTVGAVEPPKANVPPPPTGANAPPPPTGANAPPPTGAKAPPPTGTNVSPPTGANVSPPTGANAPKPTGNNTPKPTGANAPKNTGNNTPKPTGANAPKNTGNNEPLKANVNRANSPNLLTNVKVTGMNKNKNKNKNNNENTNLNKLGPNNKGIVTGIKNSVNKTKNKIEKAMKGLSNMSTLSDISSLSGVKKWGLIFLITIVVIAIIMLAKFIVVSYYTYAQKGPYLIEGTKNANHTVIISQDPNSINYIPLKRSENEDGIEFTYMFWCLYMDTNLQNNNKWKHIFHKGNSTSYPNRAPGAWFHPKENKLRIYMNTYDSPLEYIDVGNIPIKKWFHCAIVLQNKISHLGDEDTNYEIDRGNNTLDIYINGKLKQSYQLQGTPNQNNGDVYVNLFGGYDGYLSKLRYMNRAIKFTELEDIVSEGPAKVVTSDTGEIPPYLDDDWWFNQ